MDGRNGETSAQEAQVHAVMMNPEGVSVGNNRKAVAQTVFELLPTVPLYLPGSLSAPGGYVPDTPPPDSPALRTSASWRS